MARLVGCQRREHVKDFMILTEFSRCQDGVIGRLSRQLEQLFFGDKDFP
jgi:hypothetical protein